MLESPNNKMQTAQETKDGATTIRAVSMIKNEYHFPGSGIYKPMSIVASTIEEAEKIWKEKRQPVSPEEKEEKVEEPKIINNQ